MALDASPTPRSATPAPFSFLPESLAGHGSFIVVTLSVIVFFTGLGGPRLWDRDEPRNAGCAAEMLAANDWVTPVFNGELRSHKPVLLYWLMMPGYALFGVNEFTARMPSALLAVGASWLTLFIGARLFNRQTGVLSAVILCTSMMFVVAGRAATPDAVLIFFTTAATAVFVAWAFPQRNTNEACEPHRLPTESKLPLRVAASMYGLMGCAMLAKGPVGLVLPTAVMGMFLLLERLRLTTPHAPNASPSSSPRWRTVLGSVARGFAPHHFLRTCRWMRPITAITVSLAIALPWYIWVGIRTEGAWLEGFFLEHNVGRAMRPMESHGGGPWYYPAALLAGFFPWSVFAVPTMLSVWRMSPADTDRRPVLLAACWVSVYVAIFSIARTKLPSYVTPCYPALAILTAWQLSRWVESMENASSLRWMRAALLVLAIVGVGMMIGLPIAASQLLPGEQWLAIGGLIPLGAALWAWRAVERQQRLRVVRTMAIGAALFVLTAFAYMSRHVSKHQQFDRLLAAIRQRSDSARISAYECMEPSWVFYSQQAIGRVWMTDQRTAEELAAEAARPRWSPDPAREDLATFMSDPNGFVITTQWQYDRIAELLPSGTEIVARTPLFLKKTDLVVLQRPNSTQLTQSSSPAANMAMRDSNVGQAPPAPGR